MLLAVVVALFATGVVLGPARSVLGSPTACWSPRAWRPPPNARTHARPGFAQAVGLVIAGSGLVLAVLGVPAALTVAASLALVAAFLNAAFGICLGCELYLSMLRARARH